MHEWALAGGVVSTLLDVLKRKRGRIKTVVIGVGELQQIDKEVFEFALKEQAKGTDLEGLRSTLDKVPAVFKCIACRHEWGFDETTRGLEDEFRESIHFFPELAHALVRCPKCKSPDFEVARGRGVWIEKVEIEGGRRGSED